jgi:hypothetical protein
MGTTYTFRSFPQLFLVAAGNVAKKNVPSSIQQSTLLETADNKSTAGVFATATLQEHGYYIVVESK